MAEVGSSSCATVSIQPSIDRYKGETKSQLRHGNGVYFYENTFFKYEGQWKNGLKHGHGKLLMGDGGYYEGRFENGEIVGQGHRVFGGTQSTYTGQFHNGEFHGYGLLVNEEEGSQYEGEWAYNKRQGHGILRKSDGSVYEGEFHNHRPHGEGTLISGNGDTYEGDWINGLQHGHGVLKCTNGTIYEGQWKTGLYHGEGSLLHGSGFRYQGMWYNGRPTDETVQLVISPSAVDTKGPSPSLTIEQGQTFSIKVECVNDKGNIVIDDNGRSFKVTCFISKSVAKRNQSKPAYNSIISRDDATTIPAYGEVYHYGLLQTRPHHTLEGTKGGDVLTGSEEVIPLAESEVVVNEGISADVDKGVLHCGSSIKPVSEDTASVVSGSKTAHLMTAGPQLLGGALGGVTPETRSMYSFNNKPSATTSEEQFLSTLIDPLVTTSQHGIVEFNELYIPPPPAPHVDEVINKKKAGPKLLHSTSMSLSGRKSPPVEIVHSLSPVVTDTTNDGAVSPTGDGVRKRGSGSRAKKSPKAKIKEKLLHIKREKYCASGSYIIQVAEVTTPPLFDKLLPPMYIEVKVNLSKVSLKETTLDKLLNKNRSITTKSNNKPNSKT